MKIVNKLEIIAVVTFLSLAFSNQSAFSKNNDINQLEKVKNPELKTILTKIDTKNTSSVSPDKLLTVNNSLISLPIPEPLGILCILGMAGISSFLKLKIAKIKSEKRSAEKIEEERLPEKSVQLFNQ
ncbi:hypothetical protein cce_1918 [Crocosphaera subtropica ATCC 51142]|uniref:PEP-CTERM protein-sorting domain-containing protein n=1 Tax=Crocosphaera subtropica (strain ATCC 51142 / BH68) TaxID=43989 RepID=B1X0H9_CROS5|nr:hypothetical protein [Crocosphaera subtropica]ACB51268.1 hypothetical protein cce_1918 [Crocosphaera subtropica ATCC 51142]